MSKLELFAKIVNDILKNCILDFWQSFEDAFAVFFLFRSKFFITLWKQLNIKVGLSPSKKKIFVYVNESCLKMMKNAFYFILKALFVLKIFKILS